MGAQTVVFSIAANVPPEAHDAVLSAVKSIDGIVEVQLLSPESTVPEIRRMAVASLLKGVDPREVTTRVRTIAGIESADIPPARGLPERY
jgi:hypothetical protein